MSQFGQKMIDKAKSRLAPKNKWLFDLNALKYSIKDGKKIKKTMKSGKILFGDDGMQFLDDSRPESGFSIDDYDSFHYLNCKKYQDGYRINMYGRKMDVKNKDAKKVQDPMENL